MLPSPTILQIMEAFAERQQNMSRNIGHGHAAMQQTARATRQAAAWDGFYSNPGITVDKINR